MTDFLSLIILFLLVLIIVILLIILMKKPKENNSDISGIEKSLSSQNNNIEQTKGSINTMDKQLNERINDVNTRLGQIQNMTSTTNKEIANSVSQLNKVLANVKQRGVFAEMQLENILEISVRGMYEKNVKPNPRSKNIVEFAIKVPNEKDNGFTWLPLDSKFPLDRYIDFVNAFESNDADLIESKRKELIKEIDRQATKIKNLYVDVPHTTPFAIMYLATEGLYIEAVNDKNGLMEKLQQRGIMLAGPSTIIALCNALFMGFNSVKINKEAGEISKIFNNMKSDICKFNKNFSDMEKGIKKTNDALLDAKNRAEIIEKNLNRISTLD